MNNKLVPLQRNDTKTAYPLDDEIWVLEKPMLSDHIRVNRGLYYHHGIYVSDLEVIHFTGTDSDNIIGGDNKVIRSDLKTFLKHGVCETRKFHQHEKAVLRSPNEIVRIAQQSLGQAGYDLIGNNCEHFCNKCLFGRHESKQVEGIIKKGVNLMGFLGFGNKTITNISTVYEPDKVKIAEIENKTRMVLKEMEAREIKIKVESLEQVSRALYEMQKDLIRTQREESGLFNEQLLDFNSKMGIAIIERYEESRNGDIEAHQKVDRYFDQVTEDFRTQSEKFQMETLPKYLKQLDEYDKDSVQHAIYAESISEQKSVILKSFITRLDSVNQQREMVKKYDSESRRQLQSHLDELNRYTYELCKESMNFLKIDQSNSTKLIEAVGRNINGKQISSPEHAEQQEGDNQQSEQKFLT